MTSYHYLLIRSRQLECAYGRFINEILKSEGLNGFRIIDLDTSPLPDILPNDLVILSRCFLRQSEMEHLCSAVEKGSRAVCLEPQPSLAQRCGWAPRKTVIHPGWVKIREGYPGSGKPVQTHVPVSLYEAVENAGDFEAAADAIDSEWKQSGCPAVAKQEIGKGQIVFFFYDLAKAVALIRFGKPDLASCLTTGTWGWQHAGDLFAGHVDERTKHLPQADFHSQLLAKILTDICPYPLARFWYYERASHGTAVVFTSDGDMSKPDQFEELSDQLVKHGGNATFYLLKNTRLTSEQVDGLRQKGHTFAPHVNPHNAADEWRFSFPELVDQETELFKRRFGACSVSLQCHCAPWQGYMLWLPHFTRHGYRMLLAYISLPAPMWNRYMCGSGRPLKFVDVDGSVWDCWQQPVITYDDTSIQERIDSEPDVLIRDFEVQLEDALDSHHTTLSVLLHPVSFSTYSKPFFKPCMDLLQKKQVPIYNGDDWCRIQDRRHAVEISQELTSDNTVSYSIKNLNGQLPLMLPQKTAKMDVYVNGKKTNGVVSRRLEEHYVLIELQPENESEETQVEVIFSVLSKLL